MKAYYALATLLPLALATHDGDADYTTLGKGKCGFGYTGDKDLAVAVDKSVFKNGEACGKHISVSGRLGTVKVKVVDVYPERYVHDENSLLLTEAAFEASAGDYADGGEQPVTWDWA